MPIFKFLSLCYDDKKVVKNLRDIPMFTTENGVAFLTLQEIPYSGCAYVRILDSAAPDMLVKECADFCRMAGAESIYLAGANVPDKYPLFTEIWHMQCPANKIQKTNAILVSVDDSNAALWRQIYNARMSNVPTAAHMSEARMEELIQSGRPYFVYRGGTAIGIGAVSGNNINCIASVITGAGQDVLRALAAAVAENTIHLEVASKNEKAVSFYKKHGFEKTAVKEIWFKYIG